MGHSFGGQRLDFRPKEYWKPRSTVTVKIRLAGVKGADGVYGEQDQTLRFKVGRSQVSTVDAVKGGGDSGQDAAWFYDNSLIGDAVVVKNSDDRVIAADNGLNGWNMPWGEWTAGSAR